MDYDKLTDEEKQRMRERFRSSLAASLPRRESSTEPSVQPPKVAEWRQWMRLVFGVIAVAIFFTALFGVWRWFEGYRASIWAEEMRKAGVHAPAEVR